MEVLRDIGKRIFFINNCFDYSHGHRALNPDKNSDFCLTVILDLLVLHEANSSVNFAATNNGKGILLVNSNKSELVYRLSRAAVFI
jgi:hypothetical protein